VARLNKLISTLGDDWRIIIKRWSTKSNIEKTYQNPKVLIFLNLSLTEKKKKKYTRFATRLLNPKHYCVSFFSLTLDCFKKCWTAASFYKSLSPSSFVHREVNQYPILMGVGTYEGVGLLIEGKLVWAPLLTWKTQVTCTRNKYIFIFQDMPHFYQSKQTKNNSISSSSINNRSHWKFHQ